MDGEKGIAFNTLQYIPKGDYKVSSLYSALPELRKDQITNRIKEEGIYAFGGKR